MIRISYEQTDETLASSIPHYSGRDGVGLGGQTSRCQQQRGMLRGDWGRLHEAGSITAAYPQGTSADQKPFAVNVPLLYDRAQEQLQTALDLGVKIFITSAGSPKLYTGMLKSHGATVIHVVSTPELARKCEDHGVDAVVAEGFEAGGHNGRDEITTMALIPQVVDAISLPVIAAGGIGDGRGIAAALSLGAQMVQMGTRFIATKEASAHENFKNLVTKAGPCDTMLMMKKHVPVRLYKNAFFRAIEAAENAGADKNRLIEILGKGRAQKGMLEGDMEEGEIEIGQVAGLVKDIVSVEELVERLMHEYHQARVLPVFHS
jgi:enoyl-[acyl-carrier protein] reductase II